MEANQETAFRFQQRAEEIRVLAAQTKDPEVRQLLIALAANYEITFRTLGKIDRTERRIRDKGNL